MRHRQHLWVTAAAAAAALGLAACGGTTNSGSSSSSSSTPTTLTVWLMKGSAPDSVINALNNEFQAAHKNVTVNVQVQVWNGINDKVNAALSTSAAPDVLEMGNTNVAAYADSGGLTNLTSKKSQMQNSSTWLQSLTEAGTLNGKLYGVPYYAGDRVVIYNKDLFTKAGITSSPTSVDELVADGQKLMAANTSVPGFSGLYLPGKDWYAITSFIFDKGGSIAKQSGGKWTGQLSSANSQAALTAVKDMRAKTGVAAGDADETTDDPTFEAGKAAMVIEPGWHVGQIGTDKPELKNSLGVFPIPGFTQGQAAPVFLGGSNLGIGSKSKNQDLALEYIKLLAGTKYQTQLATDGGVIPNTTSLLNLHASDPVLSVADKAAQRSWFVPNSPRWAGVESNNVLQDMLAKIFTGKASVADATQAADTAVANQLNS